jgi:two-component system, NtrC family, sensor histidine kinase HydH
VVKEKVQGKGGTVSQHNIADKPIFKRFNQSTVVITILFCVLIVLTTVIIYITLQNDESARNQADQALESTALGLSSAAENALRNRVTWSDDEMLAIFSDRVVAYALIADKNGRILFHTNQRLVGSNLHEAGIDQWLQSGVPAGRRITLQTGIPAYEYNYILHRPDGTAEMLRLVVNTTPVDYILSRARKMWWTAGAVLFVLWTVGILFGRISLLLMKLSEELNRRNQMALIGQMTAVLAHEIRNALGSMKGYTQLVYEKVPDSDPKKPGLEMVLRGSDRIESLVNDLLLFSREENYNMKSFGADGVIKDALLSAAPLWEGSVELDIEPGVQIRADREKLQRVLLNGIQNALQAMGKEGKLHISAQRKGRLIQIQIRDTGPGIPEHELPRLFTPFHTTRTNGVGLGLSYSKKGIEGMGGQITLMNRKEDRGAVLTIQLLGGRESIDE